MQEVYYVNTPTYNSESLKQAIAKSVQLVKNNEGITLIVILVPTVGQFSLLSELFSANDIKNRCCHIPQLNAGFRFDTVKTYKPSISSNHILIPLCVSSKDLIQYEDEWGPKFWIIVPWQINDMISWLKVHSARDISNNDVISNDYKVDEKIKNSIGWLKATSYPNEGFNHPLDSNRLKSMANAIAASGLIVDYDAILHYCLNNNINHDGGRKIADAFVKAQNRKFKTDGNYPYSFLKEMMDIKHTDL